MKVMFNIKKMQFSKITNISDAGVPTYDSPMLMPGTVSLTFENDSSSDPFYADGVAYFQPSGTSAVTGTLENALFTKEVLKALYAYVEDSNGNMLETDGQVSEFGMQFACDSDDGDVYFTYYRVSTNKPGLNLTTNAPGATVNPQSVNVTASPITLADGVTKIIKSFATKEASNYANYFTAISVPTLPASV